jgi:hypothetical protein
MFMPSLEHARTTWATAGPYSSCGHEPMRHWKRDCDNQVVSTTEDQVQATRSRVTDVCHELVSTDDLEAKCSLVVSDVRGTVDSTSWRSWSVKSQDQKEEAQVAVSLTWCRVVDVAEANREASSQDSRGGISTHIGSE